MLGVGDTLTHPETGERLTVLAHTGEELVLEDLWPAGHRVPEHRHPRMSERWQLLTGRAAVTIATTEHVLTPGQTATAPKGVTLRASVGR